MSRPLKKFDVQNSVNLRNELIQSLGSNFNSHHRLKELSSLIYGQTRVLLSVSTLKRFFDEECLVKPSSTTLDAIASFLGYESFASWMYKNDFNGKFIKFLEALGRAKSSGNVNQIGRTETWNSANQHWFQMGLLLTPVENWPDLFSEAQIRLQSWEDQYLAGLNLALSMRNGHIDVNRLPENVINHSFFLDRITTYFIDEERPSWYLALMPKALECPEKSWRISDKRAIEFSLRNLMVNSFSSSSRYEWDTLMQDAESMSNVPIARLAGCYSQLDPGRKLELARFIDTWYSGISHDEQLRSSQFLVRQLQRSDWPIIKEIIEPVTERFSPKSLQQSIELKHFISLSHALDGTNNRAVFYHLHNSEMNQFHFNRIVKEA